MNMDKIKDIADIIDNLHMDALVLEGVSNILWDSMANGGAFGSMDIYANSAFCIANMTSKLQRDLAVVLELLYDYAKNKAPATDQSTHGAKE